MTVGFAPDQTHSPIDHEYVEHGYVPWSVVRPVGQAPHKWKEPVTGTKGHPHFGYHYKETCFYMGANVHSLVQPIRVPVMRLKETGQLFVIARDGRKRKVKACETCKPQPVLGWRERGNCWNSGFEMVTPKPADKPRLLILCEGCPVSAPCLDYAVATDAVGIYGGQYFSPNKDARRKKRERVKTGKH